MPTTKSYSKKDYERLGRMLHEVAELGVIDQKKLYRISFLKGIASGLGSVIGATVVVAVLLWIFLLFDNVPLIGPVIDLVSDKIQ